MSTREESLKQAIEEAADRCYHPQSEYRKHFIDGVDYVLSSPSILQHVGPKIMRESGWFNKSELQVKIEDNYFQVLCEQCGWIGSSEYLLGGGQIGDTGDYGDCYCPACGKIDPSETDEVTVADYKNAIESLTKIIISLRDTIEKNYYEKQAQWVREDSQWISFDKSKLPLEKMFLIRHKYGVDAVIFINGRWQYPYSATPISNDIFETAISLFIP